MTNLPLVMAVLFFGLIKPGLAQTPLTTTYFVYFTGIGCPHCANIDPVLLKQKVRQNNLMVIEYEIYRKSRNAPLLITYNSLLKTGLGIPMIIASGKNGGSIVGDAPILKKLDSMIADNINNEIVLPSGPVTFDKLSLSEIPHNPTIWFKNRVAVRKDNGSKESDSIKKFLVEGVDPQGCQPVDDKEVALSDDKVTFAKACSFGGWVLMSD